MRKILCGVIVSACFHLASVSGSLEGEHPSRRDSLSVLFWNVENFFDWRNDSTTVSDAEFSARSERHWTWKRFQAKANAFAKAIFWTEAETGRLPDIIGLAEVENAFVLRQLLQKTALHKLDYKYVHYDSPDRRGIDVALMYRTSALELLDSKPCHLYHTPDSLLETRDILLCRFRRKGSDLPDPSHYVIPGRSHPAIPGRIDPGFLDLIDPTSSDHPHHVVPDQPHLVIPGVTGKLPSPEGRSDEFVILVNHHPSKYGGASVSEPRRRLAVERLRFLADSLRTEGIGRIIACGDFNETPANPVFRLLEPLLIPLHMDHYRRGEGTIKYDGKWDLIDHFYVSGDWLLPEEGSGDRPVWKMTILRIPFLLTRDTVHSGEKPLRTYLGPRYTGGVSDHLPILLEMILPP